MVTHGSESYFVIGEGLLGEAVGGRNGGPPDGATAVAATAASVTAAAASVPPFRFSRMGPSGVGRQLGEPNRKKVGAAMAEPGGGQSQIPAGFTYLGQFLDHDLTFDKTNVMLGANVTPAQLLQARSPSLDLDSLYGAGPQDPESAKFYEADGLHLKKGKSIFPDEERLRPAAGSGEHRREEAEGDHPGPPERREPRGRPDPHRDDPVPQPCGGHAARAPCRRPRSSTRRARSSRSTTSG